MAACPPRTSVPSRGSTEADLQGFLQQSLLRPSLKPLQQGADRLWRQRGLASQCPLQGRQVSSLWRSERAGEPLPSPCQAKQPELRLADQRRAEQQADPQPSQALRAVMVWTQRRVNRRRRP